MTPSALATALRALAATAAESANPHALAEVIGRGFTAIADTLEEGQAFVAKELEQFHQLHAAMDMSDEAVAKMEDFLRAAFRPAADQAAAGAATAPEASLETGDAHLVDTAPVSEQELAAQATAPRVTLADVDANIVGEHYFTPNQALTPEPGQVLPVSLSLLTICVLELRNGFTVTGESACASPDNFDAAIGRRLARENAVRKIWPLMGYELRSRLAGAL